MINVYFSLARLPTRLLPYLVLYRDCMFALPVMHGGVRLGHEAVARALAGVAGAGPADPPGGSGGAMEGDGGRGRGETVHGGREAVLERKVEARLVDVDRDDARSAIGFGERAGEEADRANAEYEDG